MASAPVSNPTRVPFLDFARGFAILSIVVFHALRPMATGVWAIAIQFGGAGVHAFLFLSGFGLALATSHRSLQGFYHRRLRRIFVPYFVFLTGLFLLNLCWPIYPGQGLREYLSHVLLYKMFDETLMVSFGYHLWFLSTIIQLYLVFPLLFRALERLGNARFFVLTLFISSLFTAFVVMTGRAELRVFNSCGLIFLWEFALGMIAGRRFWSRGEQFWEVPIKWVIPVTCCAIALQASLSIWAGPVGEILNNSGSLLGYGGVVILAYRGCRSQGWDGINAFMDRVGEMSYSLYLVHGAIITRLFWNLAPSTLWQQLLVALGAIAISLLGALFFDFLLRLPNVVWSLHFAASSRA